MLPQTYPEGHLLLMPHPLRLTIKPNNPNHQVHGAVWKQREGGNSADLGEGEHRGEKDWLVQLTGSASQGSHSYMAAFFKAIQSMWELYVTQPRTASPAWDWTVHGFLGLNGFQQQYHSSGSLALNDHMFVCIAHMHTCTHTDINWSYV